MCSCKIFRYFSFFLVRFLYSLPIFPFYLVFRYFVISLFSSSIVFSSSTASSLLPPILSFILFFSIWFRFFLCSFHLRCFSFILVSCPSFLFLLLYLSIPSVFFVFLFVSFSLYSSFPFRFFIICLPFPLPQLHLYPTIPTSGHVPICLLIQ